MGRRILKCTGCGLPFADQMFDAGGGNHIQFVGLRVQQSCPHCGKRNEHLFDGSFRVDGTGRWHQLARALRAPGATPEDYADLAEVLRDARRLGSSAQTVSRAIRTKVPALAGVGDFFGSQTGDRVALWLAVLIPVLLWLITTVTTAEPPPAPAPAPSVTVIVQQPSEEEIHRVIKETLAQERKERAGQQKADG